MTIQSSAYQGHACTHLLLRVGASTATLAIIFSGWWLLLSHLTLGDNHLFSAVLAIAAGALSLLSLLTSTRLLRGLVLLALSCLLFWLMLQPAQPIFLWIVGILLIVHACDMWLDLRFNEQARPLQAELCPDPVAGRAPVQTDCREFVEAEEDAATVGVVHDFARTRRRGNQLAMLLIALAFLVYMVVVPVIGQIIDANRKVAGFHQVLDKLTFAESMRLHSVSGVVMLMFLAIGASIGSFLNVVIYRLPRRKALFWPPSSCSDCGARIAGQDNVPVLGWIRLGGKCRNCFAPISIRYPIIESIVGGMFVLFFYRELLTGGGNLPIREPNSYRGIVWILLYTKWDLVGIYFFHMFVLTVLLAWAMVNWDLFRVPRMAAALVIALVVSIASASPTFNPALVHLDLPWLTCSATLITSLSGCLVGSGCGWLLQFAVPNGNDPRDAEAGLQVQAERDDIGLSAAPERYGSKSSSPIATASAVASMSIVGAAFGPPAAVAIANIALAMALGLALFGQRFSRKLPPITLLIFISAVVHLFVWRDLDALQPRWLPTASGSEVTFLYSALTGAALLVSVGGIQRLLLRRNALQAGGLTPGVRPLEGDLAHELDTYGESAHEEK